MFTRFFLIISLIPAVGRSQTGCTDPLALNYSSTATINDGSCVYASVTKTPQYLANLPTTLNEVSGLVQVNGQLLGHVDDTDKHLYFLNQSSALIEDSVLIPSLNTDWEDISQDENFIYLGDFGNNQAGNRTNLHILKVQKGVNPNDYTLVDTIYFSYADQTNFSNQGPNNTDFDCEAMITRGDSLYLFTKQWVHPSTRCYKISKYADTVVAQTFDSLAVTGLITGATTLPDKQLIVLCGYSSSGTPFLELLYDFPGNNLFGGNKRKIGINANFHQVESITTTDGLIYYIANEKLSQGPVNVPAKLMKIDLTNELGDFLYPQNSIEENSGMRSPYPNPFQHSFEYHSQFSEAYEIIGLDGKLVQQGWVNPGKNTIEMKAQSGLYFFRTSSIFVPLNKQ